MAPPKQSVYGVIIAAPDDGDGRDDQDLTGLVQVIDDTVLAHIHAKEVPAVHPVRLALDRPRVLWPGIDRESVKLAGDLAQMLAVAYISQVFLSRPSQFDPNFTRGNLRLLLLRGRGFV